MRGLLPKLIFEAVAKCAALCRILSLSPMEAAAAEKELSRLTRTALRADPQVRVRVNALWSSARSGVGSLNDGWSADEVTLRAAKKEGEPGLANTGFVFSHMAWAQPPLFQALLRSVPASKEWLSRLSSHAVEPTREPFATP
jgi:hypothetical protein